MEIYSKEKDYTLYNGSMLDMLEAIKPDTIDSVITDPPYELGFMGKSWDNTKIAFKKETWEKCYKVLKPGAYLLAFGGSRTFHRIACAIEDAGFEIRDTIMWLYGSGFPKSMNIGKAIEAKEKFGNAGTRNKRKVEQECDSEEYTLKQTNNGAMGEIIETTRKEYIPNTDLAKQWNGWGTVLKPAYEPIIVARKPFKGSLVDNVIKNRVGGLNIDECRVGEEHFEQQQQHVQTKGIYGDKVLLAKSYDGRFPANVILTYDENDFNEVCGGMSDENGLSASRYFYCAKASKKDRDEGLEFEFNEAITTDGYIRANKETAMAFGANSSLRRNIHPTVKPTELMQYLVRLVSPSGATILDPFMGSGSTGKAIMFENRERNVDYKFIGIDLTDKYLPIAKARIDYAINKYEYDKKEEIKKTGIEQLKLF